MSKLHWMMGLALVGSAVCVVRPALAQDAARPAAAPAAAARGEAPEYLSIRILDAIYKDGKETEATKNIWRLVKDVHTGQQPLRQNEASFDKYFTLYVFPLMTQTDDKSLARLPRERGAFFRNHIMAIRRPEVHDHLVNLTFNFMKKIATENYHPAVRYNAMLIIGDLNSKEPVFSGAASPPLPFADALDFMIGELKNPEQIDAVRVAALLGILRHCDMNAHSAQQYAPAVRQGLVKEILPIAVDKKVPANRSEAGHAWIRGRAVEVLGALSHNSYDAGIAKALVAMIGDDKEPLDVRFVAAVALGRLNLAASTDVRGDQTARKLADLAVEASRQQLALLDAEIAEEKERLRQESGGTIRGEYRPVGPPSIGPEYTPGSIIPTKVVKLEQRLTLTQRLLKDRMLKTRMGLEGPDGATGATSAAKGTQKQYVTNVRDAVIALMKVGDLKDERTEGVPKIGDLAKEMRAKIADLERVAKTGGAPAPAPMPAAPVVGEGPDEGPDAAPPMPRRGAAAEGPDAEWPDAGALGEPPMRKKAAAPIAPAEEGPETP